MQTQSATRAAPATVLNFDGIGNGFAGPQGTFPVQSAPPDPNSAVGPNNIVEMVNSDFAVFNKAGIPVYGPVPINTLFSGFGGGCQSNDDGDGTVSYDRIANRWVIQQFSVSTTPYLECVAVSTTSDPTGAYNRYSFSYTDFPDYPKLSVWPDAYYVTYNMFAGGTTFNGATACALDRAKMLTGAAATQQCFNTGTSYGGVLASDLDGSRLPPAGSPAYMVALGSAPNTLASWRFHVDWTTPANTTFTGPSTLNVAAFNEACAGGTCIPQSGTGQRLDSLADRLMYRLAYRNFGDHEALVVNHSVTAGNSTGVRWYELRPSGGALSVYQQGTYAPDANFRWMGSIAQDQSGNMGLGYSVSSSTLHPQIRYTGRLAGDALGTMTQGEGTMVSGPGSQTGNLKRWGDYTSMAVDPSDDCTFFYTDEYIPTNGSFNWKTRIASFKFPGCGGAPPSSDFSISASPTTLTLGQNATGTSTISTAATSGSGSVSVSVSGVPSGATATLNPTSVAAGSSSTLSVNAGSAAAGSYTLTVTGTEGTATHSTTVALTVTTPPPPNDFSISASPTSLTLAQNATGTSTIATTATSGSGTVSMGVSGTPSGATATLNPTSVAAGSSSTLTVNTGSAAAGTYTITITGTEGSATHSTTVTFTVTAPATGGIVNGGFESGFNGWTTTGTTSVATSGCHGGTQCARAGSTSPTNGDASVTQTFTVPSGGSTLSFWYKVVCPDTVTYDWATATLKDNTAATTATMLPRTCNNSGSWVNVSGAVTVGHSYTLMLTSHDDNYSSDPTYTLFDDVTIATSGPPPPPPSAGITNGGFETGTLSGWTTSGAASSVASSGCHSGTYCATLGATTPTNGDSNLAQTFAVPSGNSTVSFWYSVLCPDTITYDWAKATLTDNTAATTVTVLPKTCSNTGSWASVSAPVTAGHSYTLTLTSHDDNYSSDPTYARFDDVTLQ